MVFPTDFLSTHEMTLIEKSTAIALIALPNIVSITMQRISGLGEPACPAARSQPPGWVFGLVWPVLYLLLGIALYKSRNNASAFALLVVLIAALNAWWLVFAARCRPLLAFMSIAALAVYVCLLSVLFLEVRYLLAPLLAWLSFATYLSYEVWNRNTQIVKVLTDKGHNHI